jgi:lipoprotein-releasing system ATP-binding protein
MSDIAIAAKDIRKIYKNGAKEVRAVDGVSLDIRKGSSVSIIGPSGAGKSTVLHMLGGLDTPTSGKVVLCGSDIYSMSDAERAAARNSRIGFVFQFYHLLPEFTALENVMLPAMIARRRSRQRAMELIRLVGLEGRAGHRPGELSGGESQRVAIARALINEPEVLLCDEPTGNLDSAASESIYELLFGIVSRSSTALAIVTHDDRMAGRTDETVMLKDGRVCPRTVAR